MRIYDHRVNIYFEFDASQFDGIALVDHYPNGPASLSKISSRHQISMTYLEQIFSRLLAYDLVVSTRGPGGGYALARTSDEINLLDIYQALAGVVGDHPYALSATVASEIWASLHREMDGQMRLITLMQLLNEHKTIRQI